MVVIAVGAKADTPVIDSVARRKDLMVAFVLSVKNECDVCCLRSKGIKSKYLGVIPLLYPLSSTIIYTNTISWG